MPAISRIRFTNIVYENGNKRYNDEIFHFDGHNSAILLENGGGKTVFIQTALQAIIPHLDLADRKIKDTLQLDLAPAHIAIEWILTDRPRRYALTAVSLYIENNQLQSLKYAYDYMGDEKNGIEELPFAVEDGKQKKRPASRREIGDYYTKMCKTFMNARSFNTISDYGKYLEDAFKIIPSEWRKIAVINSGEGNVDEFFNKCKTTEQLLNYLLIPVVEEAIAGQQPHSFVDTFEKQREHFNKNRILQEKIHESQSAKEALDQYVKLFKEHQDAIDTLDLNKGEMKTISNYVSNQVLHRAEELKWHERDLIILDKDEHTYQQMLKTFDLLKLNDTLSKKSAQLKNLEHERGILLERYERYASRKQNIELTKLDIQIKVNQDKMIQLNKQIEETDHILEIKDIKTRLEENGRAIKGHYRYELELIDRELIALHQRIKIQETLKDEHHEGVLSLQRIEKEHISQLSLIKAKEELFEEQRQDLSDRLIGLGEVASVNQLEFKEKNQLKRYDHDIQVAKSKRESLTLQIDGLKEKIDSHESHIKDMSKTLDTQTKHYEILVSQGEKLIKKLSSLDLALQTTTDLYLKETSLKDRLGLAIAQTQQEKDHLVTKEKRVLAHLENPFNKLSEVLKPSYLSLLTGVEYAQQLATQQGVSLDELVLKYPWWPMTFVMSQKDKEALKLDLSNYTDDFDRPIILITIDEINKLLKKGIAYDPFSEFASVTYPPMWRTLQHESDYLKIQQSHVSELSFLQTQIHYMEQKIRSLIQTTTDVEDFYTHYTYHDFQQLTSDIQEKELELDKLQEQLSQYHFESQQLITEHEIVSVDLTNLATKMSACQSTVLQLQEYHRLSEKIITLNQEHDNLYISYEEVLGNATRSLDLLKEDQLLIDELKEQVFQYQLEKHRVLDTPLYQSIEHLEPIGTSFSIESLKAERQQLEDALKGVNRSHYELEAQLKSTNEQISHLQLERQQKRLEAGYPIVHIDVFYDKELEDLYNNLRHLKDSLNQTELTLRGLKDEILKLEAGKELTEIEIKKTYGSPYPFESDLHYIPQKLSIEKATLVDRKRKLIQEKLDIQQELDTLKNIEVTLKVKDGHFGFMAESIKASIKPVDYFDAFEKNPMQFTNLQLHRLEQREQALQKSFTQIQKERMQFIAFVSGHLTDYRLRDAIIQGIKTKETYEELYQYQQTLHDVIHKIIRVAEDDRRESDIELQTFLSHLITYVKHVTEELDLIAAKTHVVINDRECQIFYIDRPEWDMTRGRELLHVYIDEMILHFEEMSKDPRYDESATRELLNERLSVKNMLKVVMNHDPIHIRCHKVTNDLDISKNAFSWESSNKWSGGEKWSKNMTLFLSLLNYLAQKKQHLTEKDKMQRCVILDNPFGKASSEHVLAPVFAIAKTLGFQLIALTAHAEGQFISQYFPVVYSCRLRDTKDPNKQMMTQGRSVNYAYLHEHAPMTLNRIQTIDQLDIFSYGKE